MPTVPSSPNAPSLPRAEKKKLYPARCWFNVREAKGPALTDNTKLIKDYVEASPA